MRLFILFISFIIISLQGIGQLKKVTEVNAENLSTASVDRLGNFYFSFTNGTIQKLDLNGSLLDETEVSFPDISLIEPWNPLNIFLYNSDEQKISYLDHHLKSLNSVQLEPSLSINPLLACPDNMVNKIWIYDEADQTIKKVDITNSTILVDEPLPVDWIGEEPNIVFMREYQNMIFMLDQNRSIFILNSLGLPITHIKTNTRNFFNFNGEELCYLQDDNLVLLDLHTGDTRTITTLNNPQEVRFTIITDERLLVVREKTADFFELRL